MMHPRVHVQRATSLAPARCRRSLHATRPSKAQDTTPQQQLLALVQELGMPAAIVPGNEPQRRAIDALLRTLPRTSTSHPPGESTWRLVYASNGTYVTRQPLVQALIALSQLPGTGLQDIQQRLTVDETTSGVRSSNAGVVGLGPLGTYEMSVEGAWQWRGEGTADVSFDALSLTPRGMLGMAFPQWMQQTVKHTCHQVRLPVSQGPSALWTTVYADDQLRVCCGATGNTFVFVRQD